MDDAELLAWQHEVEKLKLEVAHWKDQFTRVGCEKADVAAQIEEARKDVELLRKGTWILLGEKAKIQADLDEARKVRDEKNGAALLAWDQCKKLKADLDAARVQLKAWHSVFGTTQLTHAKAQLDAERKEKTELADEYRELAKAGMDVTLERDKLKADLNSVQDELTHWRSREQAIRCMIDTEGKRICNTDILVEGALFQAKKDLDEARREIEYHKKNFDESVDCAHKLQADLDAARAELDAAKKNIKELDLERKCAEKATERAEDAEEQRDAARARIADLEAALRRHGRHLDGCSYRPLPEFCRKTPDQCPCTCGLDALLAPRGEAGGEGDKA